MPIPALIAAGASIASGLIARKGAKDTNNKNIDLAHEQMGWNEQMMDKQNEWSRNMWNASNEFNDPSNQRQRLLDAGINPLNADMSNVAASPMESASVGSVSMPTLANPSEAFVNSAIGAANAVAATNNLNAQANKAKAETKTEDQLRADRLSQIQAANDLTRKNIVSVGLSNQSQEIINKYLDARESAAAELNQESVKLNRKQQNYIDYQSKELQYRIDEILPAELKNLLKNASLTDEKILSEQKNRQHIDAVIKEIGATIGKISAETGLLEQDIYYYVTNHMSNGIMGSGISIQNVGRLVDAVSPSVQAFIDKAKDFGSKAVNTFRR